MYFRRITSFISPAVCGNEVVRVSIRRHESSINQGGAGMYLHSFASKPVSRGVISKGKFAVALTASNM